MNINSVTLSGRVGRAELRTTQTGASLLNFSVCVSRNYQRDGEWESKPMWIDCVMFGDAAERNAQRITKGAFVCVNGRLDTYETKTKTTKHQLIVSAVDIPKYGTQEKTSPQLYDEDIPF